MGYCYLSPEAQQRFIPFDAGWRRPGPARELLRAGHGPLPHGLALRQLDQLAGCGGERGRAVRLRRVRDRRDLPPQRRAHDDAAEIGWEPVDLPEARRSTIVSVPLGDRDPTSLLGALADRGVVCSARDGNLRVTIHFYNHEDDVDRLMRALPEV